MSGLEAFAHALAGSSGGIVAMTLLYPLENIRTRLQVQVKRTLQHQGGNGNTHAANNAATAAPTTVTAATSPPAVPALVHTHADPAASPSPDECISPETPHAKPIPPPPPPNLAAPFRSVHVDARPVPLNTPRRNTHIQSPPQPQQPLNCLACIALLNSEARASDSASAVAASASSSSSSPPKSAFVSVGPVSGTHVLPSGEIVYDFAGSLDCVRQVIAREGWRKLYSGLSSALIGVGCSSAVYFFFYYSLKSLVLAQTGSKTMGPLHNLLVASVAGVLNVFATLPIWLVNTRMTVGSTGGQREYKSMWDAVHRIHAEEGVRGFYKGLVPSLILVSNPAIQFVVYEQCIRILTKQAAKAAAKAAATAATTAVAVAGTAAATATSAPPPSIHLSSLQYFTLGAFAKAVATVVTYPYQVVKSRQQAARGATQSTWALVTQMMREEGVGSFFNGMNAKSVTHEKGETGRAT